MIIDSAFLDDFFVHDCLRISLLQVKCRILHFDKHHYSLSVICHLFFTVLGCTALCTHAWQQTNYCVFGYEFAALCHTVAFALPNPLSYSAAW